MTSSQTLLLIIDYQRVITLLWSVLVKYLVLRSSSLVGIMNISFNRFNLEIKSKIWRLNLLLLPSGGECSVTVLSLLQLLMDLLTILYHADTISFSS